MKLHPPVLTGGECRLIFLFYRVVYLLPERVVLPLLDPLLLEEELLLLLLLLPLLRTEEELLRL